MPHIAGPATESLCQGAPQERRGAAGPLPQCAEFEHAPLGWITRERDNQTMAECEVADREGLRRLEDSLWRPETRFDRDYMERILAADFVEFGRSGRVYSRDDILELPSRAIDARLRDFAVQAIGRDVALVTYVSAVSRDDGTIELGNRSSIWTRDRDRWQLRFHQGTPTLNS